MVMAMAPDGEGTLRVFVAAQTHRHGGSVCQSLPFSTLPCHSPHFPVILHTSLPSPHFPVVLNTSLSLLKLPYRL